LAGVAETQEAHDVFSAFAHRRGMLLDEPAEASSRDRRETRLDAA
jgi:hypothetical protein